MNCPYCGDLVSYPKSQSGETSDCPYCDHEITLPSYVPKDPRNLKKFLLSAAITLTVAFLGFIVWGIFKQFDLAAMTGLMASLALGVLVVVTVVLWLVFPVFVYHYLGRIARATESSESLLQIISKNTGSS